MRALSIRFDGCSGGVDACEPEIRIVMQPLDDGEARDSAYREWVCATGACSPLHPELSTKPPLASLGLVLEAAPASSKAEPSALRAWVKSAAFGELFDRCTIATPLAANARVTLQADAKGCSQASVGPKDGVVFAAFGTEGFEDISPYVYAQPIAAPTSADPPEPDRDGDGWPVRRSFGKTRSRSR